MANESMKPAKLLHHLEMKHKDAIGKRIEFCQRKLKEVTASRSVMESSATEEHAKATEASFQVSLMIAKAGKDHMIVEKCDQACC
jgi:hypothetical protein